MSERPPVSIIIVSWNARPLLEKCLPSVAATAYPNIEIVLADNASTDGSADWVATRYPNVRIVRHPANWKFCRGNNAAVPHTSGKYVVLLNNDVEVPPNWLSPLVDALESDPRVGAVQPKMLQYDDRKRFEYAGAAGGYLDKFGYPFARGRIFFTLEDDHGQYDDETDIFWATGAAIVLRRSALDEVGLLDEQFVLHMEEIDLCWRLQRAGYVIRAVPTSEVYHIGGGSLPRGDVRKVYYNFRNSLLMLYKNLPPAEWKRVFPNRLLMDSGAAIRALLKGRPRETLAVARAYRDARRMKSLYKDIRPRDDKPAILPGYRRSIVGDYFLHGRKAFRALPKDALPSSPHIVVEDELTTARSDELQSAPQADDLLATLRSGDSQTSGQSNDPRAAQR